MNRLILAALATLMLGGTAMAQPAGVQEHPSRPAAALHQPMAARHLRHAALHRPHHHHAAFAARRGIHPARHA